MTGSGTGERAIALIGAASNIGMRPYDDAAEPRWIDRGPAALRQAGLAARLELADLGDVLPDAYRDFVRSPASVRNEAELVAYSHRLADRVSAVLDGGRFALVLGGDCSIVLGSLLAAGRHARRPGLVYIDAHDDFATPAESETGSAAGMCLGLAVGRGDSPLARLAGAAPLVRCEDVVLVGRRAAGVPESGEAALQAAGLLELDAAHIAAHGPHQTAEAALAHLSRAGVDGYWVHVDADVLDPAIVHAVDSPEPGGLDVDALAALVAPLAADDRALGLQLTIYDPKQDADGACARRLVDLLVAALSPAPGARGVRPGGSSPAVA